MTRIDYLAARDGVQLAYQHRRRPRPDPRLPARLHVRHGGHQGDARSTPGREAQGRAMLRFDYGGCGLSGGEFEAQTLARLARRRAGDDRPGRRGAGGAGRLVDGRLADAARRRWRGRQRVAGLVGIAAAPDFTDWGFDRGAEAAILLAKAGWSSRAPMASAYRHHPRLLGERRGAAPAPRRDRRSTARSGCSTGTPTRTCPGSARWELMQQLRSADVQTILVKDGDHRLSRDQDIALLIATVSTLLERCDPAPCWRSPPLQACPAAQAAHRRRGCAPAPPSSAPRRSRRPTAPMPGWRSRARRG